MEEVLEVYSTRGSAADIALDTGILHGPANTILAAKRAVEAGARALNVDAVLSGRLYLRIYTCAFTADPYVIPTPLGTFFWGGVKKCKLQTNGGDPPVKKCKLHFRDP